jgi:hypothetical protein
LHRATSSPDATLFELSKSQGKRGILDLLIRSHYELADFVALLRNCPPKGVSPGKDLGESFPGPLIATPSWS